MSDLIDRQAAIDFIAAGHLCNPNEPRWSDNEIVNFLKSRPSAQPEIIRCKDCKHRDPEDKKCDCGHDIVWNLPRQDDWYCADAERRHDAHTEA